MDFGIRGGASNQSPTDDNGQLRVKILFLRNFMLHIFKESHIRKQKGNPPLILEINKGITFLFK